MAKAKKETLPLEELLEKAIVKEEDRPYDVPENWVWTYWTNCGDFIAGNGFKPALQGFTDYEIPFYKVGSLKYTASSGYLFDLSNTITEVMRKEMKATLIPNNSLIFAKIGEAIRLNRRSLNERVCCIDNNLMSFISNSSVNFKYVYYWSCKQEFYALANATTVPAIRKSDLEMIPFPLPPLLEQKRIVEVIETLFEKLDTAKELLQNALDSFESRKSGILHKAFTGELTATWREENGVGLDSLQEKSLGNVITGFKYGVSEKSDYSYSGMPVIRIPNVISNEIDFNDLKYLSNFDIPEENQIKENDILVIRSNGSRDLVGKCALVGSLEKTYTFASYLIRIRPKNIEPKYLLQLLNSSFVRKQLFDKSKSSAGINNINSKELGSVQIPVPSVQEQQEIIRILDNLLEKEHLAKELSDVIEKIDLMKKAILARAFRGELGTNNPEEESAVELMKELLK